VLHEAVTGSFAGDVEAARRYLIDEHPAGWSYLGGDFTKPAGFVDGAGRFDDGRNQGYCHGDRHDPPAPLITEGAAAEFADYGYVLGDQRLTVLVSRAGGLLERGAEVAWSASPTGTTSTTACGGRGGIRRCGSPSTNPAPLPRNPGSLRLYKKKEQWSLPTAPGRSA